VQPFRRADKRFSFHPAKKRERSNRKGKEEEEYSLLPIVYNCIRASREKETDQNTKDVDIGEL
jgi:hypothetical protein